MKTKNEKDGLSRRDFIKHTSLSALGVSLLGAIPSSLKGAFLSDSVSVKSKVVLVRHSKVIAATGETDQIILDEMLKTAVTNFSGENSTASFWQKYFTPNDSIGLKVNTLGLTGISGSPATNHFQAITTSIIDSFRPAGIKDENFIIWDRSEEELVSAGFTIQSERGKTRVIGNVATRKGSGGVGYAEEELKVGDKTTHLSKILTEICSSIINIPLMKDHGAAGITGALKNHYGTINNARDFHSNNCTNPGIPEINLLSGIRSKQKLIIMDALMGVFNGGPRWDRNFMWPYGGILIGTDPVAIDTVLLNIINDKRKSKGMAEITESHAKHIKISGEMGLGTNKLDEIDFVKIELG